MKTARFLFGLACYGLFFATFLYLIGFIGCLVVPKDLRSGLPCGLAETLLVDLGLLALFAVQHTIMARPAFKRRWTRIVHPSMERACFVLATVACLALMFWQWRPLPALVWSVELPALRAVLWAVFGLGVAIILLASFLIGHFELFGLAQVWQHWRGQEDVVPAFHEPWLYRWTRHPIMLGMIMMLWSVPTMTQGQLLFAGVATAYIFVGVKVFEERDLRAAHPEYAAYARRVPMLFPGLSFGRRASSTRGEAGAA